MDGDEDRRDRALRSLGLWCTSDELLQELQVAVQETTAEGFDALDNYMTECFPPESHESLRKVVEDVFIDTTKVVDQRMQELRSFALYSCLHVPEELPLEDTNPQDLQVYSLTLATDKLKAVLEHRLKLAQIEGEVRRLEKEAEHRKELVRQAREYLHRAQSLSQAMPQSSEVEVMQRNVQELMTKAMNQKGLLFVEAHPQHSQ